VPQALYFAIYQWPEEELSYRLVRLVGLPGEAVETWDDRVSVGGRLVPVPAAVVVGWPAIVPDEHCLVLTDQMDGIGERRVHPDSRALGPIHVDGVSFRVVGSLPF
jgi:hypothetical protein